MTEEEIKIKLEELRKERNKINDEADAIHAKTRPIQNEIDRLEMLSMGFDYNNFGTDEYVHYYDEDEDKTYIGHITEVVRRTNGVSFVGKIITFWDDTDIHDGLFQIDLHNEIYVEKGKFNNLTIINKDIFEERIQNEYKRFMSLN